MSRALDRLYGQLPGMQCKGLCAPDACGSVGMTAEEQQNIRVRTGVQLPRLGAFAIDGELCPALDDEHRCKVYRHRPLVCRLWGMVPSMRCPHGCEPEGGLLPEPAGRRLTAELLRK